MLAPLLISWVVDKIPIDWLRISIEALSISPKWGFMSRSPPMITPRLLPPPGRDWELTSTINNANDIIIDVVIIITIVIAKAIIGPLNSYFSTLLSILTPFNQYYNPQHDPISGPLHQFKRGLDRRLVYMMVFYYSKPQEDREKVCIFLGVTIAGLA